MLTNDICADLNLSDKNEYSILCDFEIQTIPKFDTRKLGLVVVNKKKIIVNFAFPADPSVKVKESKKLD